VGAVAHGKKRMPKTNIPDCCICLFAVTIRQALFIAPCSHAFHYKCIRPLLDGHPSAFSCPLCRTFADLDEDVEVPSSPEDNDCDECDDYQDDDDDDDDDNGGKMKKSQTLALPVGRDGAETEVEGDTSARPRVRIRTAGHVLHPRQLEDLDDADLDEEMIDMLDGDSDGDVDPGNGSGSGSAEGMGINMSLGIGIGMAGMVVDGEGIVSGKRKR